MKVLLKDIVDALEYLTDEQFNYVDRQTGKVEIVSREVLGMVEEGETSDDLPDGEGDEFKVAEAIFADWDRFAKLTHEIRCQRVGDHARIRRVRRAATVERRTAKRHSRRRCVPVFQGHAAALSPGKGMVRLSG